MNVRNRMNEPMAKNKTSAAVPALFLVAVIASATFATDSCQAKPRKRPKPGVLTTFVANTQATVLNVIDADTAWFEIPGRGRVKGRFYGINAPECHKRQVRTRVIRSARCDSDKGYFGMAAYLEAVKLLANKTVTLNCPRKKNGDCETGGFGRVLVTIRADGRDVAHKLTAAGAVWTFSKYPSANHKTLCKLEDQARKHKVGMWAIGVDAVIARMSAKTRKWYAKRDAYCAKF